MADVFDSAKRPGFVVGIQLVVTDEKGEKISDTDTEWYGFDRNMANQVAMDMLGAITGVINGYRAELEKGQRKR